MEDKLMYIPNDLLLHTSNSEIFRLKKVKMIKVIQLCIDILMFRFRDYYSKYLLIWCFT